jgi:hypothetical protein
MKKPLFKLPFILLLSFLSFPLLSGQDYINFNSHKEIKLDKTSEIEEIILPVRDSVSNLSVLITSSIYSGDVTIEVYDPEGERHGYFSIGAQPEIPIVKKPGQSVYSTDNNQASGNLSSTIRNPAKGNWKIRVIPKNTSGNVKISYALKAPGHIYIKAK